MIRPRRNLRRSKSRTGFTRNRVRRSRRKPTGCTNRRGSTKRRRSIAQCADMGNDVCQLSLGRFYEGGHGVTRNDAEAVTWYRKSADQNNAIAAKSLGLMYELGKGVPENWSEAARLYAKGAETYGDAAFNLGRMYEFGTGFPKTAGMPSGGSRKPPTSDSRRAIAG